MWNFHLHYVQNACKDVLKIDFTQKAPFLHCVCATDAVYYFLLKVDENIVMYLLLPQPGL